MPIRRRQSGLSEGTEHKPGLNDSYIKERLRISLNV